jgi:hypothetical protein
MCSLAIWFFQFLSQRTFSYVVGGKLGRIAVSYVRGWNSVSNGSMHWVRVGKAPRDANRRSWNVSYQLCGCNRTLLMAIALNTNQLKQVEGDHISSSGCSGLNEGEIAFNNFSNFTTLTAENDFDLEYMQWIMALQ